MRYHLGLFTIIFVLATSLSWGIEHFIEGPRRHAENARLAARLTHIMIQHRDLICSPAWFHMTDLDVLELLSTARFVLCQEEIAI